MSGSIEKGPNAYVAYMVVATISALSSIIVVAIALNKLTHVSDAGMLVIAVMSLAPILLGIGIFHSLYGPAPPP